MECNGARGCTQGWVDQCAGGFADGERRGPIDSVCNGTDLPHAHVPSGRCSRSVDRCPADWQLLALPFEDATDRSSLRSDGIRDDVRNLPQEHQMIHESELVTCFNGRLICS
jgi:hypothetical protein